jgi:hypothetical protein
MQPGILDFPSIGMVRHVYHKSQRILSRLLQAFTSIISPILHGSAGKTRNSYSCISQRLESWCPAATAPERNLCQVECSHGTNITKHDCRVQTSQPYSLYQHDTPTPRIFPRASRSNCPAACSRKSSMCAMMMLCDN